MVYGKPYNDGRSWTACRLPIYIQSIFSHTECIHILFAHSNCLKIVIIMKKWSNIYIYISKIDVYHRYFFFDQSYLVIDKNISQNLWALLTYKNGNLHFLKSTKNNKLQNYKSVYAKLWDFLAYFARAIFHRLNCAIGHFITIFWQICW